jgi:hypothetical protein
MPKFETDDDRTYFLTTWPIHPAVTVAELLSGETMHDDTKLSVTKMTITEKIGSLY